MIEIMKYKDRTVEFIPKTKEDQKELIKQYKEQNGKDNQDCIFYNGIKGFIDTIEYGCNICKNCEEICIDHGSYWVEPSYAMKCKISERNIEDYFCGYKDYME